MRRRILHLPAISLGILLAMLVAGVLAQDPTDRPPLGFPDPLDRKLPNGKTLRDGIVKADYERNLEDAAEMKRLATEIQEEFAQSDRYVMSAKMLKKLDDVERLSKDIRNRLKRR
jgi:hypothetical protein